MEPEVAGFQQARRDLGAAVMALRGIKPPRPKSGEQALDVQGLTALVCEASAPLLQASRYKVEDTNSMQACRLRELLLREVWRPVLTRVAVLARQLATGTAAGLAPGPRSGKAPAGMLSMGDFNHLRTALEILSLWGIYPHLEGVGLALERRPETKAVMVPRAVLAWGMAAGSDTAQCASGPDEEQRRAILEDVLACGEVLEMAMGIPQFSSLLTARYNTDVLALYLQLSIRCPDEGVRRTASERLDRLSSRLSAYQLVCNLRELLSRGGAAPGWLRRECAVRMTSVLMSAGGLRAVVEAFVGHLPPDTEHIEAAHMRLAQLIASRPSAVSAVEYTSKLGPQLAGLLHTRTDDRPLLARLCAVVVGRLSHRMPQETWDHVLTPLLKPLLALSPGSPYEAQPDSSTTEDGVVWSEEDVSTALDDLNTLLTHAPPPPAFINVLATQGSWHLVGPLMELWAFAGRIGASVAEKAEAVLLEMLTRSTQVAHVLLLEGYLHMTRAGRCSERRISEVVCARGGQGGVMVVRRSTTAHPEEAVTALEELQSLSLSSVEKDLARADEDASAVVLLVSGLGPQSQTPGLLLERLLLAYIQIKTPHDALNMETLASHCSPENRDAVEGQQEPQSFIATAVLMKLLEKIVALGAGLFGSGAQIIRCCALLLHLATQSSEAREGTSDALQDMNVEEGIECQEGGEPFIETDVEELGAVVMSVLLVVLELGEDTRPEPEETALRELLPLLVKLTQRCDGAGSCASRGLVEMALSLQAVILTRSLSLAERAEMKAREAKAGEARAHGPGGLREVLQDVEGDLQSPLPPLRARGISTLTKMIHSIPKEKLVKFHDESARNEEPQRVVQVLIRMLGDHESFVYLAAVQGLAVMSEKVPSMVMSRLLEVMEDETFPWAQRLKAGEALVQAAMRCGEAIPKYALLVVAAFVKGARRTMTTPHTNANITQGEDAVERAHFRLSCLSALAEVCGLLRFSIPRYLQDVCDLAIGILTHEQRRRQSAARLSKRAPLIEEVSEDRDQVPASAVVQHQQLVNPSGDDQGAAERSQEESQHHERLTELSALARRGAAFLLGRLLSGSGTDVHSVLGGKLTVIKQTLVMVAETDSDAVTRLHASRALGTLEDALWQQVEWSLDADRVMAARPIEQLTRRLQGRHAVDDAVRDMGLE